MDPQKVVDLYRSNIEDEIFLKASMSAQEDTWTVKIVNKQNENRLKKKQKIADTQKQIIQSHLLFSKPSRLSLKSDTLVLIEYIEQRPLILSNLGMNSVIQKYVYPTRLAKYVLRKKFNFNIEEDNSKTPLPEKSELIKYYKKVQQLLFGALGETVQLSEGKKLSTVGQITHSKFCGVTLLNKNLSSTPIFPHKPNKNHFVLVIQ